jgi:serine-type D-Ala-D-Ala carboxypeptidase/endopeptidase
MMYRRSMTYALLVFALPGLQAAAAAQTARQRKEITLPAATLARYVGTYELAPGKNLAIRLDGSQLNAQLPGQGERPIFPESETKFFLKVVDAQLEFGKDAAGAVTHVVLHQNGIDQKAMRRSATAPPPPEQRHKETTVPVSTLSKYPGTYELRSNIVLTVTLEGDHLMAQLTGQRKFQVFPESETVFFYKTVKATLEFQHDGSGATTGVRLKQGTVDQVLPKLPKK